MIAGETGSGKTTQIPKIALELGRGREGQIGHTQPRRIAARSVAERINEEIAGDAPLGGIVGYQVRFTDTSSQETLVKVMTDGILLAQIQRDPMLRAYDTLIIDEAHERSLNIDFILGYLTRLLPQRPDLKVVITSATIDSDRFARHFARDGVPAPVVEVTGRTFPVEIRYRPLTPEPVEGRKKQEDRDPMTAIAEAVDELMMEGPGDILVFLSGEREIRDAEDTLRGSLGPRATDPRHPQAVELLPLYSRLSAAEQHRVFDRHQNRRVVLSTNVAETSLTVPGIRYVIDPGTARISRFSKATKVQRLPIEPISQASANQRSGRCGRVADGIAIRLYSQDDFESRPMYTEPEILRTSLASVILQMIAVGVAATPEEIGEFPFVDPPDTRAVRDGVQLLTELGALDGARLTETGKALAQLPMDPRLARMIVEGGRRNVAREVMIIAAALSIQDPRERPAEEREKADLSHSRFADPTSDLLTYLNLWQYLKDQQRDLSGSAFRRQVRSEYLNYLRIREWQDVVTQLRELAKPLGIVVNPPGTPKEEDGLKLTWDGDRIHVAILAGLLSQIGMQEATEVAAPKKGARPPNKRPRNEYLGARGARFAIFPGSGLARKPPAWVMAAELVETSRLWGRDVARIQPEWAEEVGAHLVKRTYSDPAWSSKQGAATALERVLLYGVPIVTNRRVLYAKVDPEHARELFVRHALVQGEWTTHHQFFHENRRLLAEAEGLEARARRRDLVVDDDTLFAFYDERVPSDVVSARHFDQWWKVARRDDPDLLSFTRELLVGSADAIDESSFPSRWPQGDLRLPLTYQFEPGTEADGVTVHIPLTTLARLQADGFGWMVPGLREELITATIRALPKPVRVQLVPAPDVARAIDTWITQNTADWEDTVRAGDAAPSFRDVFRRAVRDLRDVDVPDDAFDDDRLPPHLRMTFRVVGDRGGVVDEGKDLQLLQRRLAQQTQSAVDDAVRTAVRAAMEEARASGAAPVPTPTAVAGTPASAPTVVAKPLVALDRTGLRTWPADLPELPEVLEAGTVRAYPTLVEEKGAVAVRSLADETKRPGYGAPRAAPTPAAGRRARDRPDHEPLDRHAGAHARVESVQDDRRAGHRRAARGDRPPDRADERGPRRRHLRRAAHHGPRRTRGHSPRDRRRPRHRAHRRARARRRDPRPLQPRAARDGAGHPLPGAAAGPRRVRQRGRRRPAPPPDPVPARREAPAGQGRREPAARRRPRVAGAGRRGRLRRRGREGSAGRRRPLDARGAARQPLRAAARHAGTGLDHPHQEGAHCGSIGPCAASPATRSPHETSCAVVTTGSVDAAPVATCSGVPLVACRPSASSFTNVRVTVYVPSGAATAFSPASSSDEPVQPTPVPCPANPRSNVYGWPWALAIGFTSHCASE